MRVRVLGIAALIGVVAAALVCLLVVPADLRQGDAQRIMYPHVASAWLAYLSFGVTALAGIGWLWRRDLRFDAVALAGAEIGVIFTAFTLWAGMMWGQPVWGVAWQWEDPRILTTSLLLALYVGYLLLRRLSDEPGSWVWWPQSISRSFTSASSGGADCIRRRPSGRRSGCSILRRRAPSC
jgi:heme exporter protein C